ncbi:MAG: HAD family phosphatase, partial [Candidatus Saccharimonadales bacterium]
MRSGASYMDRYSTRASQPATQQSAKSAGRVASSACQQASTAQRPFAVFDIDGTLIRWQLYHAIADALSKRGYVDDKAYQKVKDARMLWKRRSESEAFKTYETQLVGFYDQLLNNLSVEHFNEAAGGVFDEYKDQVYTYTRDLIKKLKEKGYLLFAISGSQSEIVELIANYYEFDDFIGTTYERSGKFFTGTKIAHLGTKHEVLKKLAARHRATFDKSVAVGDSTGDITILEAVAIPIALNPEQKLFAHAKKHGWKVVVERKNMVYELESR